MPLQLQPGRVICLAPVALLQEFRRQILAVAMAGVHERKANGTPSPVGGYYGLFAMYSPGIV